LRKFDFPVLKAGDVIELPVGADVLGEEALRRVYIRDEYIVALKAWDACDYILLGAPGIGKSTLAFLLFCREMSKGETVLLIKDKVNALTMKLFYLDKIDTLQNFDELREFSKNVVVIYDGQKGFQNMGGGSVIFKKVLVVHSPSAGINNSKKALKGEIHVMEPYALEEAKDYATKLDVNSILVEDNFTICGGLMRQLLWKSVAVKIDIDEGCEKLVGMDMGPLCRGVLVSGDDGKLCHRVLHLHRKPGGAAGYFLEFASKYVETKIVDSMAKQSEVKLLQLANEIDINGSLRGGIFENRM
jgi:hypothetical protein